MAWWGWALIVWAVVSVPVAIFIAKMIAVGKHWEER